MATTQQAEPSTTKLVDVNAVAEMLGCSTRHVYRLSDAGKMPAPIKLGSLVRWNSRRVEQWLEAACPSCKKPASGRK